MTKLPVDNEANDPSPRRKRQRPQDTSYGGEEKSKPDTRAKEEETADLEKCFHGDAFITEEERQEQSAAERRLARKRRLQAKSFDSRPGPAAKFISASKSTGIIISGGTIQKTVHEDRRNQDKTGIENSSIVVSNVDNKDTEKNGTELVANNDEKEFDMFSSSVSPPNIDDSRAARTTASTANNRNPTNVDQQQDWDDAEGYYKATIGEIITLDLPNLSVPDLQFRVSGVIGRGVFSTVLKCTTESSTSSTPLPPQVALKCIRHNETMAKAAHNEIRFLQRFTSSPGIIPLLLPTNIVPLEYRGHIILVFPYFPYNLRDVLTKFGKGVGLSLTAVGSYFGQLLAAATHLKQHNLIHSDLKPDNILVSDDFSTVQLCDFGSAVDGNGTVEMVTPYLVSRFYRAPEIILGLIPTYAIDLWSLAVTVAELFLGRVLFQGMSNNDMLHTMMQHMGPVSNRLIRQHLVQTKRFPLPAHFTQQAANYVFRQETVDAVSGHAVHKAVSLQEFSTSLQSKLLKAKSAKDSRTMVLHFSDLLQKCLTLDPSRRIAVKLAMQHEFFKDKSKNRSSR